MADKNSPEGAELKPKMNTKMLIIVGVVVLLLAGIGAGAFFFFMGDSKDEAGPERAQAEKADFSSEGLGMIGPMVEIEDFIINIIDEQQDARYLKAALTLELDRLESVPEVEQRMPQIRDAILLLVGNKTFNEVRDLQGKLQLRAELIARINALLQQAKVNKVYFTDFVVQ